MVKFFTRNFCWLIFCVCLFLIKKEAYAEKTESVTAHISFFQQQYRADTSRKDSLGQEMRKRARFKANRDSVRIQAVRNNPNVSLQQMLKGSATGVYIQEPSGEPGTEQSIIVQGQASPIFNKKDIYANQAAVYLNGVFLAEDNPFAYDVQKYDFNRIGPSTNVFSGIDIDNVQSIEIIKDPVTLAKLGPNAVNGAIWITTKPAKSGLREINLNTYAGFVQRENPFTVNGVYESRFRESFYAKYATPTNYANKVSYLRDSTNQDYFGKSDWDQLYYQTAPIYAANIGITGGSQRANFRFFGSGIRNAGNADNTNMEKYNANFAINMAPFTWVTLSSFINASRIDRDRNKNLRDRYAEVRYLPSFVSPLSPVKENYQLFLDEYKGAVDDNRNNLINGAVALDFKIIPRLMLNSSIMFDYNEGIRDVFYPKSLMDGNNFVSNYFGYSQRFSQINRAEYDYELNANNNLKFELGQSIQMDTYKYNYARGYSANSDFKKLNVVDPGPLRDLNAWGNFYLFRYTDKMKFGLASFYGSVAYNYKDLLTVNAVLRRDGSSNNQPDTRWRTTPALGGEWNLKNHFLSAAKSLDELKFGVSWSRVSRIFMDDRFAGGPQYRTETGWFDEPTFAFYGGLPGLTRTYLSGWVGYNISSPFSDKTNISLDATAFNRRLSTRLVLYNKNDKNQVLTLPMSSESGYTGYYKNGLDVNNKGIDFTANTAILDAKDSFKWTFGLNLNFNKNTLKALPDGVNEVVYGTNKLQVGKPVGAYWLYTNQGIYNSDAEVPVNPANNQKLTYKGIPLTAGDPKWVDYNGDYRIDELDKQMIGSRMPKLAGGFQSNFTYKSLDLSIHFVYALGQQSINQADASRYDFITKENANDLTSIKEITTWQTLPNKKDYPVYNPWSDVIPYRVDQDLFLENSSYLKLRTISLGYDLAKSKFASRAKLGFRRAYFYLAASNLLTFTQFSGSDPELVGFNGYYDGVNITIPKTYTFGIKLEL